MSEASTGWGIQTLFLYALHDTFHDLHLWKIHDRSPAGPQQGFSRCPWENEERARQRDVWCQHCVLGLGPRPAPLEHSFGIRDVTHDLLLKLLNGHVVASAALRVHREEFRGKGPGHVTLVCLRRAPFLACTALILTKAAPQKRWRAVAEAAAIVSLPQAQWSLPSPLSGSEFASDVHRHPLGFRIESDTRAK